MASSCSRPSPSTTGFPPDTDPGSEARSAVQDRTPDLLSRWSAECPAVRLALAGLAVVLPTDHTLPALTTAPADPHAPAPPGHRHRRLRTVHPRARRPGRQPDPHGHRETHRRLLDGNHAWSADTGTSSPPPRPDTDQGRSRTHPATQRTVTPRGHDDRRTAHRSRCYFSSGVQRGGVASASVARVVGWGRPLVERAGRVGRRRRSVSGVGVGACLRSQGLASVGSLGKRDHSQYLVEHMPDRGGLGWRSF